MQSKGIGPKQMNWELNKPQTGIRRRKHILQSNCLENKYKVKYTSLVK